MDVYMDEYYENIDEFDISSLLTESERTAIVAQAKTSTSNLKEASTNFFKSVDDEIPKIISELKSVPGDTKIKLDGGFKKVIDWVFKGTDDMLTDVKKYTKPTKFGRGASAVAWACGWLPPITLVPGSSEILFASTELVNFLLEFKRRWTGANRSAINDYIVACDKIEKEITADAVTMEKISLNATKVFKFMKKTITNLSSSVMIGLRGGIVKGYNKVYKGAEKAGKAIDNATKNSKSGVGKKVNNFGKKLNRVSSELVVDSQKAIDKGNELKAIRKEQRAKKKEAKAKAKLLAKSVKYFEYKENDDMLDEEKLMIYEAMIECMQDTLFFEDVLDDDTYDDELIEEGANLEVRSYLKQLKREYKAYMKEVRKGRMSNDYPRAIKAVKELEKITDKYVTLIQNTDSSAASFVLGYFTSFTITFLRDLGLTIIAPFTMGISAIVGSFMNLYENWGRGLGKLANHEKVKITDDFNTYKNKTLSMAKKLQVSVKDLEKTIMKEANEFKRTGEVRLSNKKPPKINKLSVKKESVSSIEKERIYDSLRELRDM